MKEAPSFEVFDEMKAAAIAIWQTYDNQFGYVTEKVKLIDRIINIQDNAMVFYRMFDYQNQSAMRAKLSLDSLEYINNNR
jgi:hypothetical protein